MSGSKSEEVHGRSGTRVLDVEAVLFHHGHLQSGFRTTQGCRVCQKGLEGVMAPAEEDRPMDRVPRMVEGDGADGEANSPFPFGSWNPTGGKESEVLGNVSDRRVP